MKALFARRPEIKLSISSITRAMREGEIEGEKYHFVSRQEFEDMIKNNELLEHNVFVGNYYGTPKKPVFDCIEAGIDMVVEVDVNGAAQIRSKMPEAVSIFIMPPSYDELKRRLIGRGTDSLEVIRAKEYDFVVKNDIVEDCVDSIIHIIEAQRVTFENQKNFVDEVLNKC